MGTNRMIAGVVLGLLVVSAAGAAEKWLHVRVEEHGGQGERVSVNIPLSVVERMLPLISVDEFHEGRLRLDEVDEELGGIDLRELAAVLRDAPDAEFVTVERSHENVRVAKEGSFLVVRAADSGGRTDETVRVRLPLDVVDALVSDDPNELDFLAALRALGEYDGDPLVDVHSDDSSVLVWIDSSESGSGR